MTEQQKVETPPATRQSGMPSNTVFIGQKPIMAYVTAIVMQFTSASNAAQKALRDAVRKRMQKNR